MRRRARVKLLRATHTRENSPRTVFMALKGKYTWLGNGTKYIICVYGT